MAKLFKIIIFATFIVTVLSSLKLWAGSTEKLNFKSYVIYYPREDSLLARKIVTSVKQPLADIEHFFGRKPGSAVTIYLTRSVEDYRKQARGGIPEWSQAVANLTDRMIVIKLTSAEEIERATQILLHEMVHIFLADRVPHERIPNWLAEGLADYLAGDLLSLNEKLTLANAMASGNTISLQGIDSLAYFRQPRAQLAYAQALTAIEFFIAEHGRDKLRELIINMGRYHSVNDAFRHTVGYDFIDFEIRWFQYIHEKYRWIVVLNFDNMLWAGLSILAILVILIIRWRNRKKLREWEALEEDTSDLT